MNPEKIITVDILNIVPAIDEGEDRFVVDFKAVIDRSRLNNLLAAMNLTQVSLHIPPGNMDFDTFEDLVNDFIHENVFPAGDELDFHRKYKEKIKALFNVLTKDW